MIRVTIELDPGGLGTHKRVLHEVEIANDLSTTLATKGRHGTYGYTIKSGDPATGQRVVRSGVVRDFPRNAQNALMLLGRVLKDAYGTGRSRTW